MMAAIAGFARTGWAGIAKARFVCCAISMVGRVAADCERPVHRPTGAVSHWKNSGEWSCSKAHGTPRPIIPSLRPALPKLTWMLRIRRSRWLHRRDSEITARAAGGRWQSATWRSIGDYAVGDGRDEPRGRKSGGG